MKTIRVNFINFWYDFEPNNNIFLYLLKKKYNVIVDNVNPDFVFTGQRHENKFPNAKRIFFCGEPQTDVGSVEISLMQYDMKMDNSFRFPLYLYYIYDFIKKGVVDGFEWYSKPREFDKTLLNRKFCNFVCGGRYDGGDQYRDHFFKLINNYKRLDCPGTRYNNMERLPGSSANGLDASDKKREFIKNYKFTMGFENNTTLNGYNGYTTEKFIEPLTSNSLLLYWGNPNIGEEFNNKSFLNFHDYKNENDFINKIIEVDTDDSLYEEYMTQPYVIYNKYLDQDYLVELLKKIIE